MLRNFLNPIKDTYNKTRASIILNCKIMKPSSWDQKETRCYRQRRPVRQRKKNYKNWKEETELWSFKHSGNTAVSCKKQMWTLESDLGELYRADGRGDSRLGRYQFSSNKPLGSRQSHKSPNSITKSNWKNKARGLTRSQKKNYKTVIIKTVWY